MVPDLVPSQVGMFGFFQSGDYRVDPEQYIKVMGLDNMPVEKINTYYNDSWSISFTSLGPAQHDYENIKQKHNIINEMDTDDYYALLTDEDTVYINFKDNENKDSKTIEIFDIPYRMNEFDYGPSILLTKDKKLLLKPRDDEENMMTKFCNYIKIKSSII